MITDYIGQRILASTTDVKVELAMLYRQLIFADFRQRLVINKRIKELKKQEVICCLVSNEAYH